ncbi:MAG: hypothetical protein AOA65_0147 [Candidatus Bathyarchaeota archaeon BA1]|nr:MAG: hypothetical protein AOA65_0147 [Candidatus Bathyarchaeota archaeon BA1]
MAKVQVNVKLDEKLLREVEVLIKGGYFNTKTEAFMEALQLLIRSYKAGELARRIDRIREGTEKMPSVTEEVVKAHEEENEQ